MAMGRQGGRQGDLMMTWAEVPRAPAPLGGGSRSPSRMGMIEKLEGPGSLEAVCMEQHPYQPNACGSVRKELPNEDAAKLFYRVADDFATRRAENG